MTTTNLDYVKFKTELSQSDIFGTEYNEILESSESGAFSITFTEDVAEYLNVILMKYDSLTDFQTDMLFQLFNQFNIIRTTIDPNRLKPFQHAMNSDNELLLYRETPKGLVNIIINPEDCIAFSFLSANEETRKFYFVHPGGDFESLAYHFFGC